MYHFAPMTESHALQIAAWRYPPPDDVYNLAGGLDDLAELLNGEYRTVLDKTEQLIGFFCFGAAARVPAGQAAGCYQADALDIGLGLRPDLTGQGLGSSFLMAGIDYAVGELAAARLRLTVLSHNQRAISVYERNSFLRQCEFSAPGGSGPRTFLVMTRECVAA